MKDKFSMKNFALGLLAGVVLVVAIDAAVVAYAVNAVKQGTWQEINGVRDVIQVVRQDLREENKTSTSGILKRVGESDFEIEATMLKGKVTLRFTYDSTTQFIKTANDDDNTPMPVNPQDMELGQDVAVQANEPIGSVENQHAVKVVDF
jgi:hypothetical protein